jgi:hypothetical protein
MPPKRTRAATKPAPSTSTTVVGASSSSGGDGFRREGVACDYELSGKAPRKEPVTPPWLGKLEKCTQEYFHRYHIQLRKAFTPRGSLNALYPLTLPDEIEGVELYWHCTHVSYRKLDRAKDGCLYIERRSERGGHRLMHQGDDAPKMTLKQAIDRKLKKIPPPPPKPKPPPVKELFAAPTFPKAWCHAVHKVDEEDTMLIVGFNENCAAYKFMHKSEHANVCTDECDILLEGADEKPGPGVIVAEVTEGATKIRVIANTLSQTGDEVAVRPTLPDDIFFACPECRARSGVGGSMRYRRIDGKWDLRHPHCYKCARQPTARLCKMLDGQHATLSAQEFNELKRDRGIERGLFPGGSSELKYA